MGNNFPLHEQYPASEPTINLGVNEMIELAKAGVKVELYGKVIPVIFDPPPPLHPPRPCISYDCSDGIRDRLNTSLQALRKDDGGSYTPFPDLYAVQHGDKVFVFVALKGVEPELITDDAAIYPSDALLAKVKLHMGQRK